MRMQRDAFEAAVRRHHAAVYRTARRIVRSDADAADVAQQVFLHAFRGGLALGSEDDERRLRWLASRLALTALRAARRRRHHEQEMAMSTDSGAGRSAGLSADEARILGASIEALDDEHRAVVMLRFGEGLTLAAIGEITGHAESTVHGRLHQALAFLRRRLTDHGFALALPRVEQLLQAMALEPIAVPATLPAQLLLIPSAATGLAAAKVAAAALLLVGIGGTALAAIDSRALPAPAVSAMVQRAPAPAPVGAPADEAVRTLAAPDPPPVRQAPPASPRQVRGGLPLPQSPQADARAALVAAAPRATIVGSIAQPDGQPLAAVAVTAWCRALSSKGESFEITATTDARGVFVLELPITNASGLDYRLGLRRPDWSGAFVEPDLHLLAGDRRTGVDAVMHRTAADQPGEWSTRALVTDVAGRPLAQVAVQVFRRLRDAAGAERLLRECGGTTGADGGIELRGDHFGDKVLEVAAFGQPFAGLRQPFAVTSTAPTELAVALAADTPLALRVLDARTRQPVPEVAIAAERGPRTLAIGRSGADGTLLLRGTDAEPCTLSLSGDRRWSTFRLDGVVAGQGTFEVQLKRSDDPEPIGLHGCEVHGRVVDAATGAPLAVEYGAVGTWWFAADAPATAATVLAGAITPHPYQTCAMADPPPPSSEFHLAVATPGRYALILRVPGRAIAVAGPFDLAAGQLLHSVELRAEVGTEVVVEVRDVEGQPVADVEVWLDAADAGAVAARAARAAELAGARRRGERATAGRGLRSSAAGRCAIAHVPSGVELCVHAADAQGRQAASAPFGAAGPTIVHTLIVR